MYNKHPFYYNTAYKRFGKPLFCKNGGQNTVFCKFVRTFIKSIGNVCAHTYTFKATPHKARLKALYWICLHIFRHLAQKFLDIRQYACGISIQSDEKSVGASPAQALCGIALMIRYKKYSRLGGSAEKKYRARSFRLGNSFFVKDSVPIFSCSSDRLRAGSSFPMLSGGLTR